jgi:hypothetical protein
VWTARYVLLVYGLTSDGSPALAGWPGLQKGALEQVVGFLLNPSHAGLNQAHGWVGPTYAIVRFKSKSDQCKFPPSHPIRPCNSLHAHPRAPVQPIVSGVRSNATYRYVVRCAVRRNKISAEFKGIDWSRRGRRPAMKESLPASERPKSILTIIDDPPSHQNNQQQPMKGPGG